MILCSARQYSTGQRPRIAGWTFQVGHQEKNPPRRWWSTGTCCLVGLCTLHLWSFRGSGRQSQGQPQLVLALVPLRAGAWTTCPPEVHPDKHFCDSVDSSCSVPIQRYCAVYTRDRKWVVDERKHEDSPVPLGWGDRYDREISSGKQHIS